MELYDALDLTPGEKKVYKALVTLKRSSTGPLYREASVSQSKVYEILDRLKKKGLATSIIKDSVTYWHPADPTLYLEKIKKDLITLKKRKLILDKELPELIKTHSPPQDDAQVFMGYNGFKSCLQSLFSSFEKNQTILVFGSPKNITEPYYTFLKKWNYERVKKGFYAKFLYGEIQRDFASKLYDMKKTQLAFIEGLTPSTIVIGVDRIIIMTWEKEIKCVQIRGEDIAQSYGLFFESLWKMAKK